MARSKRTPRAKNKIESAFPGELIKIDPDPYVEAPRAQQRVRAGVITRSTMFSADFEAVIEIIATERVYRAMLAGMKRRFLAGPPPLLIEGSNPGE